MTIKIVTNRNYSKQYIKKKTNIFFKCKNRDWVRRSYLFDKGILLHIFNKGINMDSLSDEDEVYALINQYIEYLFHNTEIAVYGCYDERKIISVKGVKISKL